MFCQNTYQCSLKEDNKGQLFMLIHKTWCQILKVIVQLLSCVRLFMMSWSVACQAPLSSPVSWSLLKLMSTESMMLSNHPLPPSSFALFISNIRVFSSELAFFIRWPKYWSLSFSISPYSEYSRLISFKIDQFDILTVQRILRSLLQHHE